MKPATVVALAFLFAMGFGLLTFHLGEDEGFKRGQNYGMCQVAREIIQREGGKVEPNPMPELCDEKNWRKPQ